MAVKPKKEFIPLTNDPGRIRMFGPMSAKDARRLRRAFLKMQMCEFRLTGYIEQVDWGADRSLIIRVSGEPITVVPIK